jgi:hypothetical protein
MESFNSVLENVIKKDEKSFESMSQTQQISPVSSVSNVKAATTFEKPLYKNTKRHILDDRKFLA